MKIYIAAHKRYEFPDDNKFQPIHVGKAISDKELGFIGDDTGGSISDLNPFFCELTALYWVWKNTHDDIIGLMHYRRYFSPKEKSVTVKNKKVASSGDFDMERFDIVLSSPRNYVITSIYNHYKFAHNQNDMDLVREIIKSDYPSYSIDFDTVMKGRTLCLYNMFVAKKNIMDEYFSWLFDILFKIEKEIPYKKYDAYQKRVFGFIAERLFNVWILHNKDTLRIQYRKTINIEGENLLLKAKNLIGRHFLNKK